MHSISSMFLLQLVELVNLSVFSKLSFVEIGAICVGDVGNPEVLSRLAKAFHKESNTSVSRPGSANRAASWRTPCDVNRLRADACVPFTPVPCTIPRARARQYSGGTEDLHTLAAAATFAHPRLQHIAELQLWPVANSAWRLNADDALTVIVWSEMLWLTGTSFQVSLSYFKGCLFVNLTFRIERLRLTLSHGIKIRTPWIMAYNRNW